MVKRRKVPPFPQLMLMEVIRPTGELPSAAHAQATSDDWDHLLTFIARRTQPLVAWWWGSKRTPDGMVAWCYLCGEAILKAGPLSQITQRTREQIDAHRLEHVHTVAATLARLGKVADRGA